VVETHGDVAAAFARAARIFEHEFTTPRIHQAPLEPRAAIVWLEGDHVQVISTNKAPFNLRDQMAATLGLAKDRIVVDNGTIGGAYAAGRPTVRLLVEGGVSTLEGYRVPAARHEAATVYTNNVPGGHMRAPGQPQNVFASESHLDLIARELGITPLELRRRNV